MNPFLIELGEEKNLFGVGNFQLSTLGFYYVCSTFYCPAVPPPFSWPRSSLSFSSATVNRFSFRKDFPSAGHLRGKRDQDDSPRWWRKLPSRKKSRASLMTPMGHEMEGNTVPVQQVNFLGGKSVPKMSSSFVATVISSILLKKLEEMLEF